MIDTSRNVAVRDKAGSGAGIPDPAYMNERLCGEPSPPTIVPFAQCGDIGVGRTGV